MYQSRGAKCMVCDAVFCCPSHRRKHEISIHNFVLPKNPGHNSSNKLKENATFNSRNSNSLVKSVLVEQTRKRSLAVNYILRSIQNRDNIQERNILKAKRKLDNHAYGPPSPSINPVTEDNTTFQSFPRGRDHQKADITPANDNKTNSPQDIISPPIVDGVFTTSTPLSDQENTTQTSRPASNPCDTPATTQPTGKALAIVNPSFSQRAPTPFQNSGQKRKLSLTEFHTALDELPSLLATPLTTVKNKKPKFAGVFSRITSFVCNVFNSNPKENRELTWAVLKTPGGRKRARMFSAVRGRQSYRKDV